MKKTRIVVFKFVLILLSLIFVGVSEAEQYPSRALDFVVPFAEESLASSGAKVLQEFLSERIEKGVRLVYSPGVKRQNFWRDIDSVRDDGHIFGQFVTPDILVFPLLGKGSYDIRKKNFVLTYLCEPQVLMVREYSSLRDVESLLNMIENSDDIVEFAGEGVGSAGNLAHIEFVEESGAGIAYRPYDKDSQARQALRDEEVLAYWGGLAEYISLDKEKENLRVLAISSSERLPSAPYIPIFADSGINIESKKCFGLMLPETADSDFAKYMSNRISKVVDDNEYRNQVYKMGFEPYFEDWRSVGTSLRKQSRKIEVLLKKYGIIQ